MGHLNEVKKEYKALQKRLDKNPVGAPENKYLYDVLKIMFTSEQAELASKMPMAPATLGKISRKSGVPKAKLQTMLEEMADRGAVMDFLNERTGKTFYILAPTVVGFFEFSLMRERSDIPQKEIAEAMYHYMYDTGDFADSVFRETTQLGRSVVHETALSDEDLTEVLDWERATRILEGADKYAVSLCYCRHKARHVGHACGKPEETCLSIGMGADWAVRRNFGREISLSEALDIIELAREEGLVHTADNVQQNPTFICNCCGCCCGMLGAINKHGISNAVHTSGFLAAIDLDTCKGCGKCVKRCPIDAIKIKEKPGENGKKIKWAEIDESICLGCGVCERACKFEALSMKKRKKRRILTPESTLERTLTMAIERDKLHHFIFDEMDEPGYDFLKTLTGAVLKMPVSKRILLSKEVKSRFIDFVLSKAGL